MRLLILRELKPLITTAKLKTTLEIPNYHDLSRKRISLNTSPIITTQANNIKIIKKSEKNAVVPIVLQNIQGNFLQGVEINDVRSTVVANAVPLL